MNDFSQSFDSGLFQQPAKKPRNDFLTAQFIEIGIAIQMLDGTYAAAEYLKSRNIDMDLATRALTQPLCRRTWREWNYPTS
jgi:hypothetical protein